MPILMNPLIDDARLGLTARTGLFRGHSKDALAEPMLKKALPEGFKIGASLGDGDCFFDSMAQSLSSMGNKHYAAKNLRKISHDYVVTLGKVSKDENWIYQRFLNEAKRLHPEGEYEASLAAANECSHYMANIAYTNEEIEKGHGLNASTAIWGEQDIDGRILCEQLKINFHVIEIHDTGEGIILGHQLNGKSIDEHEVNYQSQDTAHVIVFNNHFVPLLPASFLIHEEVIDSNSHPAKNSRNSTDTGHHQHTIKNEELLKIPGHTCSPGKSSSLAGNIRKNWENTVKEKKLQTIFDCWQPVAFVVPDSEETQIAQTVITEFLEIPQPGRVLLISGESGGGKSTLARYLANSPPQQYVPLYIELASMQRIDSNSFLNWVRDKADSSSMYVTREDVTGIHWLLILDGYDELKKDFKESNLYEKAELWRYDVTVIITSRPSAIPADNETKIVRFSPSVQPPDEYSLPIPRPQQLYSHEIAPFTSGMQEAYLRQQWKKNSETYLSIYHRLPSLKQLTERPFLLWLLSQEFPVILEKANITEHSINLEQLKITQQALYDSFIESWLNKHYVRLKKEGQVSKEEWPQAEFLLDAKAYMNKLAYSLYRTGQTRFKVECPSLGSEDENKAPSETTQQKNKVKKSYGSVQSVFSSTSTVRQIPQITDRLNELRNPDGFFQRSPENKPRAIKHLLTACLLTPLGEETYAFLHKSLLEHCTLDKLLNGIALSATIGLGCNLNELSIVNDNDMLQEAAKRLEDNAQLQDILFDVVRSSRHEPNMAQAAANAITLLNRIGFNFSKKDLRRIRIKGANLHRALCDNTDFSEADLREVDFSQAWLRGAKFDKACLDNVEMGELPYLALSGSSYAICYSPQGQWLAVGEGDKIVLYDTTTHQKVRAFTGHANTVTSVTFNPAGNVLASASQDETIRLWDAGSGQRLNTLKGHANRVTSVTFNPAGNVVASASEDKTVRLWDTDSGRCLNTLEGHTHYVCSVSFHPASNLVASASQDETIRLWDADSGQCLNTLKGHAGSVYSVTFNPAGNVVASANSDNTLRLWDTDSGRCLNTLKGHTWNVFSVTFNPAGNVVASASWDKTIRLWDTDSGQCLNTLKGHSGCVKSVSFHPTDNVVASASDDRTIRLWDADSGRCLNTLKGHAGWVFSVTFHPAGNVVASASEDKTVRLWDTDSGQCLNTLKGHTDRVFSVTFNPAGNVVASASEDKTIRLWDSNTGNCLLVLPLPYAARSLAWNNESQLAAASGNTLSLWKIDTTSYQADLLWISGSHGLMASQLSLHQATGLLLPDEENPTKTVKSSAALLLEQHGAVGQLSRYHSEKVLEGRNEHYVYENPIKPLLWKENNILLTPNGSSVVSLVRSKRQRDNNEHAFLLIESVEQENEDSPALYRFRRADLFLDETANYTRLGGYLVEGKSCISLNDKSIFDIEMLIPDCEYISFILCPEQKQQLLTAIEKDTKQPPGYVLTGKGSLLNQGLTLFSDPQNRHNCLTWCEEKLSNLGFSKKIRQQKSWLDGFAAVSSWHLPEKGELGTIKNQAIQATTCTLL